MSDDVKPYTREELDELDAAHRRKDGSLRGPGSYGMLSADEFERLLATAKQGVEALDAIHRTAVSLRWWVQYGCDDEEMANVAGQLETFAARAVSSSASETTKESPAAAVERGVRESEQVHTCAIHPTHSDEGPEGCRCSCGAVASAEGIWERGVGETPVEVSDDDVDHAVAAMRHEFGSEAMVSEEDAVRVALRADRQRRAPRSGLAPKGGGE